MSDELEDDGDEEIVFTPDASGSAGEVSTSYELVPPEMDDASAQRVIAVAYLLQITDKLKSPALVRLAERLCSATIGTIGKGRGHLTVVE